MQKQHKQIGVPEGKGGTVTGYQTLASSGAVVYSAPLGVTTDVNFYLHNGADIPDFMARKKAGELLPYTPWTQIERSGAPVFGHYDYIIGSYRHYHDGVRVPDSWEWVLPTSDSVAWALLEGHFPDFVSDVDFEDLIQAAAADIYSRGWDALTWTAELTKTIRSFRRLGTNLARLLEKMRRELSLAELYRFSGEVSEWWLRYRYEWRILYYDMQEITQAIKNLSDEERSVLTSRVGNSHAGSTVWSTDRDSADFRFSVQQKLSAKLSYRGSVAARITPPNFAFNPLTTAWEITIFSFIIDWFVDVGQWLESMSFRVLAQEYTAASGFLLELELDTWCVDITPKTGGTWHNTLGYSATCKAKYTKRLPRELSNLPQQKLNLNVAKVTDLLALIRKLVL